MPFSPETAIIVFLLGASILYALKSARTGHRLQNEIADRKRIQKEFETGLREREAFFSAIPDVLYVADMNFRSIKWNKALETVTGFSPEELLNKECVSYFPPEEQEKITAAMQRVFSDGYSEVEGHMLTKSGRKIPYLYNGVPLRDEAGNLVGFTGTGRDLTHQKKAEEQRLAKEDMQKSRDDALLASRAKSEFLANMSHEIRTPLNAVLGFAQLIQMDANLSPGSRTFVDKILQSGRQLHQIFSDILDLSRVEAGKMDLRERPFDLTHLLHQMTDMFQVRCAEKQLSWRLDATGFDMSPEKERWVSGDEVKLRQVLINLIGNAVKFTDSGEVALRATALDHNSYRFEVADTGCGIQEELREVLFEPFQRGQHGVEIGGTGLGLAICKRMAGMMGGELGFTSQPGKGSRFYFTIPLQPSTPGMDKPPPVAPGREEEPPFQNVQALTAGEAPKKREIP